MSVALPVPGRDMILHMESLNLADTFVTFLALLGPQKVLLAFAHLARTMDVRRVRLVAWTCSLAAAGVGVVSALMNANTASLLLVPALRRSFAGLGPWARLVRLRAEFQSMLTGQMDHGRSCPGDDAVLGNLLRENDPSRLALDDDDLQQQLRTMVIAGHDTTALALNWALVLLAQHPDARVRLEEEIDSVLGGRRPTTDDVPRLRFVEQVVTETLRLYPTAWAIGREAVRDTIINAASGHFKAGDQRFTAVDGGIGIAKPAPVVPAAFIKTVDRFQKLMKEGKVAPPTSVPAY